MQGDDVPAASRIPERHEAAGGGENPTANPSRRGRSGGLLKAVGIIGSGTVASQMILAVGTLVLARLYPPDQFGPYAAVTSLVLVLAPLATLKWDAAIVPADRDEDAWGLVRVCLASVVSTSLALALIIQVVLHVSPTGQPFDPDVLVVAPILFALVGLFTTLTPVALRQRDYRSVARRSVLQSSTMVGFQAGLGIGSPTAMALATGEIAGRAIGALSLTPAAIRLRRLSLTQVPFTTLWSRYGGVVRTYLPAALLDGAAMNIVVILIATWYGGAAAGATGLVLKSLAAPVAFVGTVVGQAMVAELGSRVRTGRPDVSPTLHRAFRVLVALGIVTALAMLLIAPSVLPAILGPSWTQAGELAQAISVSVGVWIVWNPMSGLFIIYQKWRQFLVFAALRLLFVVSAGSAAHFLATGPRVTLGAMMTAGAAIQILGIAYTLRLTARGAA